ncbi:MAG TPA: outer membrane beta-barrel protein [Anditalea sp.]|nr:outer membrane beta-barrel protein [Anditalea sp.]
MKNLIYVVTFLLLTGLSFTEVMGQSRGGYGIKAGLNYNSNGNYFREAGMVYGDPLNNLGFHAGAFGKLNLGPIYLRPELVYGEMRTELDGNKYLTQRMDAPLLVGLNLFGSLVSVFAGPSFHYTLKDDLINYNHSPDDKRFNAGYQAGVGLNLGRIGLDLRYEREFRGQSVNFERVLSGGELKYQQLLLGLSIRL